MLNVSVSITFIAFVISTSIHWCMSDSADIKVLIKVIETKTFNETFYHNKFTYLDYSVFILSSYRRIYVHIYFHIYIYIYIYILTGNVLWINYPTEWKRHKARKSFLSSVYSSNISFSPRKNHSIRIFFLILGQVWKNTLTRNIVKPI